MIDYKRKLINIILNSRPRLSVEQEDAVVSDKRYIRIVAGAGSGKTETLTRRIVFLLLCKDVAPDKIVAFTFTEKAAKSMKSRIYERVRFIDKNKAKKLKDLFVSTIHSFCLKLLRENYGYENYSVIDENQETAFILRHGRDIGIEDSGYIRKCRTFLYSQDIVYNELIDEKLLKITSPEFYNLFTEYNKLLEKNKILNFGRIIYLATKHIREDPAPLNNIEYLIVDEYQDINRSQEFLIKKIGEKASVFIVGDPRQTIYQWRGSDESCFREFSNIFRGCQELKLKENRRSGFRIVELANKFADAFETAKYPHLKATRNFAGHVFLKECLTPEDEAEWITAQIRKLVGKRLCKYSDIAILLRSVRSSSPPFIQEFRENKIPFIIGGKVGLFRRDEINVISLIFSYLAPEASWRYENNRLEGDKLLDQAFILWREIIGDFNVSKAYIFIKDLKDKLDSIRVNLIELYYEILDVLGYKKLNPSDNLDSTVMANLGRFSNIIIDYESSMRRGGKKYSAEYLLRGFQLYIKYYARYAYEENISDSLPGVDAVSILTIHQAKGLEWPVVFIPCVVNRRFPSSMTGRERKTLIDSSLYETEKYAGRLEDERKLFYVAITRARDLLCISTFEKMGGKARQKSQLLVDICSDLVNLEDRGLDNVKVFPLRQSEELDSIPLDNILLYRTCPYLYRLRELWQYRQPLVLELDYGRCVHLCLQKIGEYIRKYGDITEAVNRVVDRYFFLPYTSEKINKNMKNGAKKDIENYIMKYMEDITQTDQTEYNIEIPISNILINGKIDALIRKESYIELREYKISDEMTLYSDAEFQIKAYAVGLKNEGIDVKKASVLYLKGLKKLEFEIDDAQAKTTKREIADLVHKIKNQRFRGKPSQRCGKCDYRNICRYAYKRDALLI